MRLKVSGKERGKLVECLKGSRKYKNQKAYIIYYIILYYINWSTVKSKFSFSYKHFSYSSLRY